MTAPDVARILAQHRAAIRSQGCVFWGVALVIVCPLIIGLAIGLMIRGWQW